MTHQEFAEAVHRILNDCQLVTVELQALRHKSQKNRGIVGLTTPGLSNLLAEDTGHFIPALHSHVDTAKQQSDYCVAQYQVIYDAIASLLHELGENITDQYVHQMQIHHNASEITKLWAETQIAAPCPN